MKKKDNFWDWFDKIDTSHEKSRKDFLINHVKKMTLNQKIEWSRARINEFIIFCKKNNLSIPCVSFSGGKDSAVLLDLVSKEIKNPKCIIAGEVFHPENAKLIKNIKNKELYKPKMSFDEVIDNVGFPMISKEISQKISAVRNMKTLRNWIRACFGFYKSRKISRIYLHLLDTTFVKYELSNKCCDLIKGPVKKNKEPKFVGTTVFESQLRRTNWLKNGCNVFKDDVVQSRPISIWTQKDVYDYVNKYNVKLSKAYEMGWERTGCLLCGFGLRIETNLNKKISKQTGKPKFNRIELLKIHYPTIYKKYIWDKKMYKPLADSYVEISNDKKYMSYYVKRQKEIENWYANLDKNILKIIKQIEKRTGGKFTKKDIEIIKKNYNIK